MPEISPLIVTGSIAIDRLLRINGRYQDLIDPAKLDSLAISVFVNDITNSFGGVAANICHSLALLGNKPVLLGSAGTDARSYLEVLGDQGVDLTALHYSDRPTATFTCLTDTEQNQIGGFYPGAMSDADNQTLAPWKEADPLVVVGPHDPAAMKRQVHESRQWGLRLVYDVGQQVSNLPAEDIAEGVEAAHILILNEYEMAALCRKIGRLPEDVKAATPIVVTTLGKHGSRVEGHAAPEPFTVGVAAPDRETDPTGAGDAYRAGFLHGYARNWPLTECAQLGAVTGSYALEQSGTLNHRFSLTQAAERYMQTFNAALPNQ